MPYLSKDYGQSGDEWVQIEYGKDIWNYFKNGDKQALDYSNKSLQFQHQELYGGLFDYTLEVIHRWMPSVEQLKLRHFFNAIFGALLMLFTGLLARRLSKKWSIGFLALLFIFFSPRIFGESMNNPKDIPFATGFVIGVYAIVAYLQDFPRKAIINALLIAVGLGIAFGVRSAGGILLIGYFILFAGLYYITNKAFKAQLADNKNRLLIRIALIFVGGVLGGYIIGLLAWPWGIQSPVSNTLAALQEMTNRSVVLRVLFEGEYRPNNNMPWYYEFKWILMTSPLIIIAGVLLYMGMSVRQLKKLGAFTIIVPAFCAFFPLLYMIYKHSSVHDTWRHVFFVYPGWVVMGAMGFDFLTEYIKNEKRKMIPYLVAVLGLLPAIVWTVRSHPNQYVYFNESVGGVKGAYGYYDIDYYQNSGKQAADWIKANAKPIPGRRMMVRSNMSAYNKYFEFHPTFIDADYGRYTERNQLEWDYYVAYPRYISAEQMQNGKWDLQNTVHKVEIDGVPLCVVVARKSRAGIEAHDAMMKKDYATAVEKYKEYIQSDTTDEYTYVNYGIALASIGQLDDAVNALRKATEIDATKPEFFETLAQVCRAKGDMQGFQSAMNKAQELALAEQEKAGEQAQE